LSELDNGLLDCYVERNLMVEMRDGVRLATDLYRPAMNGKPIDEEFPTLLVRTPYDKNGGAEDGKWFCRHGYTVCIQDLRGVFNSEGAFGKYENSDVDGYDTIEWIAKQDWSTGKVGTFGGSFLAHVQVAAAAINPPHLSAMVLTEGGYANAFSTSVRHGGAFEMTGLTWLLMGGIRSQEAAKNPVIRAALQSIPLDSYLEPVLGQVKKGITPFNQVPNYENVFFESLLHTEYDDYWKTPWHSAELYYEEFADVPTLIQTGWYDHYTENDCKLYRGLSRTKKGPIKLIVGPWTHGGTSLTYAGEVEFGPKAPLDVSISPSYNHLRLRWFDRWLKGIENNAEEDPAVRIFTMGGGLGRRKYRFMQHGGTWNFESDWPLPETKFTSHYMTESGNLTPRVPIEKNSSTSYTFDPRNPVPTIGGQRDPHYMLGGEYRNLEGAYNQVERKEFFGSKPPFVPLTFRNDVLVFKTQPLPEPIEVTGPVKVKLWISTTAPDTDFTAKLVDWYPPNIDYPLGFAMNLTDGITRARYRDSWERPTLLKPNEIYPLEITMYPTSNLFAKNHMIRVDISSSNYPRFDINPNTGDSLGKSRRFSLTDNTVYHEIDHPSHIILPIIKRNKH
jgi:putative CocE/NonD family hydrolase